jgi:hypothetical protein
VCTVTVAVAACASVFRRGDASGPTLLVHNTGPAAVELHVLQGVSVVGDTSQYTLGTVFAGETACFGLEPASVQRWVTIKSLEGSIRTLGFIPSTRAAWSMELRGDPRTDVLALQPADDRCKPGERFHAS